MRQEGFPCGKHCDASLDKIALGLGGRKLEIDALGKGAGTRAYAPASCTAPRSSNTDASLAVAAADSENVPTVTA